MNYTGNHMDNEGCVVHSRLKRKSISARQIDMKGYYVSFRCEQQVWPKKVWLLFMVRKRGTMNMVDQQCDEVIITTDGGSTSTL